MKIGLNAIAGDSYFLRLKNNPQYFMHKYGEDANGNHLYTPKIGHIHAGIWKREQADVFISLTGATNLELVPIHTLLANDGTLN